MKKLKVIALSALAFVTIASMVFVSCQKEQVEKTNNIFSNYIKDKYPKVEVNTNRAAKMDPKKVRILVNADGIAALGAAPTFTNIFSAGIGLWVSFYSSYKACSWCPQSLVVNQKVEEIGYSNVKTLLESAENTYASRNPYNNIGKFHNDLLLTFSNTNIFNNLEVSDEIVSYINNDNKLGLNPDEKNNLITLLNIKIPEINSNFSPEIENYNTYVNNMNNLSEPVRINIIAIITGYENIDISSSSIASAYFKDIELKLFEDNYLTQDEKNSCYMYIAVLKYSNCYWTFASNL
jgi:hypothetical protein